MKVWELRHIHLFPADDSWTEVLSSQRLRRSPPHPALTTSRLRSGMPSPANYAKKTISADRRDSHPVYSDFSHLASQGNTDIGGLAFVAGLRGTETPIDVITRILPMMKIVPAESKARQYRLPIVDSAGSSSLCMKEECIARRNLYNELNETNRNMKSELSSLRDQLAESTRRINDEALEIRRAEERNESLTRDIEAVNGRFVTLSSQSDEINQQNETLRAQLRLLRLDLERAKVKSDEAQDRLNNAICNKTGPSVVFKQFNEPQSNAAKAIASEISMLSLRDDVIDSDDDN